MSKPKKNDDEKLIHDTEVLLQKYRQVKWALDVAANKEMRELKHETGITEEYLHAAVFAGADISNTRLERRAQSMERSRQMLALVNESVELMRQFHPMGEIYYEIISRYYLSKQQKSQSQVLEEMEEKGIYLFSPGSLGEPRGNAPSYGVIEIKKGQLLLSLGHL